MTVLVTGATGFVGAHVTRALVERGDDGARRLPQPGAPGRLGDLDVEPRARARSSTSTRCGAPMRGCDVVFHAAGMVGSTPVGKVWEMNQRGAARRGRGGRDGGREPRRRDLDDLGRRHRRRPPRRRGEPYPEDWLGLVYADSKRVGEREAIAAGSGSASRSSSSTPPTCSASRSTAPSRGDLDADRRQLPARASARGARRPDQLRRRRGRRATGHLLAADRGAPGERYILGGHNRAVGRADRHGRPRVRHPPPAARHPLRRSATSPTCASGSGLPGAISAEAFGLMGQDWRFTSAKAKRELGYRPRPLAQTDHRDGRVVPRADRERRLRRLTAVADVRHGQGLGAAGRLGLLWPLRPAEKLLRRRLLAGR